MTTLSDLARWVPELARAHVLVMGDVMLDRFVHGRVTRISPEAPVPILRAERVQTALGGAGNVARNLESLGATVLFVGAVGEDNEGREIRGILESLQNVRHRLMVESSRPTTVKTRFVAENQQVLRVDAETCGPISRGTEADAITAIAEFIDECELVIISDYKKGFLTRSMIQDTIQLCRRVGKPVLVDPKGNDFAKYERARILTPNVKELAEATGLSVDGDKQVATAASRLIKSCQLDAVLATRGPEGMSLVSSSGEVMHLRADAREVFDVSGAGDTVIAVFGAGIAVGAAQRDAACLANTAAGVVVGKVGTAVVYPLDLIRALHQQQLSRAESKVLSMASARDTVDVWRRKGLKVGFTNGVFDVLHAGHLKFLKQAASICDRLIVGINGDLSVRQIRHENPVQEETTRAAIVASLEMVDLVVLFQEEAPVLLLQALQPDVLVGGANLEPQEVVGADIVRGYGGRVIQTEMADIANSNPTLAAITGGTF